MLAGSIVSVARPLPAVAAGEAPILVITPTGSSNPFSSYVTEILAAEGFDQVQVSSVSTLTSSLLTGRRVVILGETTLTSSQITALDNYVSAGGGLIAMRPVSGLNTILGLGTGSGTTSDAYMRITDGTIGAGLYSDTMQFHGTANSYTMQPGTTQVAELYSSRTSSAGRPAVTIATRGSGRAAMFAYDLGRSVVMTRQGNPANANVDTDGDGILRSIDLYRNWTDLERTSVPQADVQGRLLSRLIEAVSPQPMPRLWFFPGTASTVLVMTGDAHANPDQYFQSEITDLTQHDATGTFFVTQAASPSAANVAAWRAQGWEFSIHPYVDCGYACGVDANVDWLESTYGVTPTTTRTHQVRWSGWTDAASIEASRGLKMDFNSYQWGSWVMNSTGPALGYLNGGGMPMRYMDASGNVLSIYQQHTSLVDEFLAPQAGLAGLSLSQAVAASHATIDDAVDHYNVPVATQFHVDYYYPNNSDWATETVDYALSRGGVSMTANDWLNFVQGRAATTFSNTSWAGNVLTMTVSAGGANQTLLMPLQHRGNSLTGIKRNGSTISYSTLSINGTTYAAVNASSGTYTGTYAADTTAPTVTGFSPSNGAVDVPVTTPVTLTFSEVMQQTATRSAFSITPNVAGTFAWNSAGTTMTFTPSALLADSTQYSIALSTGATDLAGNHVAAATNWTFTTAAVTPPPAVTGVSPNAGPIAGGTVVTISGSGLTGASAVRFGDTNAASFTVVNETTITATTPARSAGAVHVTVTTPAGTSPAVAQDQFTYVDASSTISVLSIDPGTASTAGGTVVTITGSGFVGNATVSIGGTAATNVTVVSTTRIRAKVPAHAAGTVNVVVNISGSGSATLANGFTYLACASACLTQTTTSDFATGTAGPGSAVVETTDGEVSLAATVDAEFSGSTVPSGFSVSPWTAGGGAVVGNGSLSLDAALLTSNGYVTPGRALEFVATFSSGPHQHIGLGIDLNNSPWAIFSTGPSGGALYARTNGSGQSDTQISGSWLGSPHRYRIEWTSTNVTYFIDGVEVATHAVAIPGEMRPVASDGPLGGATLGIDWMRLTPYAASGSYTSRVIDSGGAATWQSMSWSADVPAGTTLSVFARAGNTAAPDSSWSAFAPVSGSGGALGLSGRFVQYRIDLATSSQNLTPALRDLTIAYSVSGTLSPAIASVTPDSGPTSGGTVVTIAGANFAAGATVTVGGVAATNVTVTATSITATTPAHAAGAVDVIVTNPDSQSGEIANGYTYIAGQPSIASVAPNAGPTTGGTSVTITGSNLLDATTVTFGAAPASSFTVVSDTEITAVAPAQAEGAVDIRVTTAGGTSPIVTGDRFTYIVLPPSPVVTAVDPGTGPVTGGATIQISGANFGPGMSLKIGDNPATSLTVVSSAMLTATVPAGVAGAANVTITSPSGQQNTLVGGYSYLACTPDCLVDTTAANFSAGTPDASTRVTEVADGEIRLAAEVDTDFSGSTLPSGWNGAPWTPEGSATVSSGRLTVDSALVATDNYYTPGRSLEFVATFGNGAFQHAGLGTDLNGAPWMIFSTGSSGTALYARSNSSLPGVDTLIPGNWLGTAHRYRIDWTATTVTYSIDGEPVAQHTISVPGEVRPVISDGPPGGASVSIDWMRVTPYAGSGSFESRVFDAGAQVEWGSIGWSASLPSGTGLTMSVRGGDTPTPDGTWSAYAPVAASGAALNLTSQYLQYRVDLSSTNPTATPALRDVIVSYGGSVAAPVVSGVSPSSGLTTEATAVTISGTGFSGATGVTFGGSPAAFSVISDVQIQATAPTHAEGVVDVIVSTPAGDSAASSSSQFTYVAPVIPPDIISVSPTSGSVLGGTAITVSGTGFVDGATVTIGGTAATNVTFVNATTLTATTPAHAAGAVDVQVTNPVGTNDTLSAGFTYIAVPVPVVSSVTPNKGSTAGGGQVTITGSNFASGATVQIGGVTATNVVVASATSIQATVPAHVAGQVAVTVTNVGGEPGTLANGYQYVAPVTAAADGPDSISVQDGIQFGGTANSLATNNNSDVSILAERSGSNRVVTYYGQYTVPSSQRGMLGLTIAYDGGASTGSGITRTISLYNWDEEEWEVLRTEAQTSSDLLTTIVVTGDATRFMASNGRIRMQIRAVRSSSFTLYSDMMNFTVTYLP